MEAVSAYILELRAIQGGPSHNTVAAWINRRYPNLKTAFNGAYVGKLEAWRAQGRTELPNIGHIEAIVAVLGGNLNHVGKLLRDEEATVEFAKRLARAWRSLVADDEDIAAIIGGMEPEDVIRLAETDARTDAPLVGFAAWLRELRNKKPPLSPPPKE